MSIILSGCPHIKYDDKKNCEICKLTGKPTGTSLKCDFDYDTCKNFKKNMRKTSGGK